MWVWNNRRALIWVETVCNTLSLYCTQPNIPFLSILYFISEHRCVCFYFVPIKLVFTPIVFYNVSFIGLSCFNPKNHTVIINCLHCFCSSYNSFTFWFSCLHKFFDRGYNIHICITDFFSYLKLSQYLIFYYLQCFHHSKKLLLGTETYTWTCSLLRHCPRGAELAVHASIEISLWLCGNWYSIRLLNTVASYLMFISFNFLTLQTGVLVSRV